MFIIKVNNLIQSDGRADYKGLDLDSIIAGSQLYPKDTNTAYLKVNQTISHEDIVNVSESEYENVRLKELSYAKTYSQEERIKTLEDTINMMLLGGM